MDAVHIHFRFPHSERRNMMSPFIFSMKVHRDTWVAKRIYGEVETRNRKPRKKCTVHSAVYLDTLSLTNCICEQTPTRINDKYE